MSNTIQLMKLFSDETRLRVLMLLVRQELCVCQIMGVLGVSQPLVSKNLAMLSRAGLVGERKEGKLVFYSLNRHMPDSHKQAIALLVRMTEDDKKFAADIRSMLECREFQKKTGRCDMKTFRQFMARKSGKVPKECGKGEPDEDI